MEPRPSAWRLEIHTRGQPHSTRQRPAASQPLQAQQLRRGNGVLGCAEGDREKDRDIELRT